ncbi:MAG: SDR family NAD(P)-dependent oxidoreductase, partial [Flavisolibacter sp.]|nr:SDR family NAD(P)-dependent oxidoreductase [Flavisolibacter sp.]
MTKKLEGKTAVVTGGSSGIGKAIAIAYSKHGANVVVNYHSGEDEANEIVEAIKKEGGNAIAVGADVSKEEDVFRLFKETYDHFHSIDILVCNAGIQKDSKFSDMSLE